VHGQGRKQELSNCWNERPWRSDSQNKQYRKVDVNLNGK